MSLGYRRGPDFQFRFPSLPSIVANETSEVSYKSYKSYKSYGTYRASGNATFHSRSRVVRTVITGGAGFIGSHLCERFLAREHEVVITIEEGAIGGFASHVLHHLATAGLLDHGLKIRTMVLPDLFLEHDSPNAQYEVPAPAGRQPRRGASDDRDRSCLARQARYRAAKAAFGGGRGRA